MPLSFSCVVEDVSNTSLLFTVNSSTINQNTFTVQVFDDDIVEITEIFQLMYTAQDPQVELPRNRSLVLIMDNDRKVLTAVGPGIKILLQPCQPMQSVGKILAHAICGENLTVLW